MVAVGSDAEAANCWTLLVVWDRVGWWPSSSLPCFLTTAGFLLSLAGCQSTKLPVVSFRRERWLGPSVGPCCALGRGGGKWTAGQREEQNRTESKEKKSNEEITDHQP